MQRPRLGHSGFFGETNFKELLKNNQGVRNCETLLEMSKIKAVYCCKLASEINSDCSFRLQITESYR